MTRPNYYKAEVDVTDSTGSRSRATLECFDLIDAICPADFYLGNAVKYIFRAGAKSPDVRSDLDKAITYLEQAKERLP